MLMLNLKEIMNNLGLSIQDVYEGTGISRNTISQLYNGKSKGIQFSTLTKLVDYLDVAPEELFTEVTDYKKLEFDVEFSNNIVVKKIINKSFPITSRNLNDLVSNFEYFAMVLFIPSEYENEDFAVVDFKLPIYLNFNYSGNTLWIFCDRDRAVEDVDDRGNDYEYIKHETNYNEFIRANSEKDIENTFLSIVSYISNKILFHSTPEYIGFKSNFGNSKIIYLWQSDLIFNDEKQKSYIKSKYE